MEVTKNPCLPKKQGFGENYIVKAIILVHMSESGATLQLLPVKFEVLSMSLTIRTIR
jgi:hypothetical protein